MINSGFLVYTEIGLYCPLGNFFLDPNKPVAHALVSHAHADHATRGSLHVYATNPTLDFMKFRYRTHSGKHLHVISYKKPFNIGDVKVTFFPAGHMLGSAQILMEYQGIRYLYTGDIKLQNDVTCESVEFCQADVLITETTFANPDINHPSPDKEIMKLDALVDEHVVIGCYALGKAQRLTKLLSDYFFNREIHIHNSIVPYHRMYERYGYKLGSWKLFDRRNFRSETAFIYLVPPLTYQTYAAEKKYRTLFASGWESLQQNSDIKLLISDHIDWKDLMSLIKAVNPTEIWTLHGQGKYVQEYFQGKINVKILT